MCRFFRQECDIPKCNSKSWDWNFWNILETARANYLTSVESKRLAKKIYDKTKLKYTEGVSNSFELTQNEQQYLKAHGVYIGAVLQLLKANVAYKKAVGKL